MQVAFNFNHSHVKSDVTRILDCFTTALLSPSNAGGSQRFGWCNSFHYECIAGLPYILADFQYHGGQLVCWQILLLLQRDSRRQIFIRRCKQQDGLRESYIPKLHRSQMEKC